MIGGCYEVSSSFVWSSSPVWPWPSCALACSIEQGGHASWVAARFPDVICIDPAKVSGGEFSCGKCPPCRVNKQRVWTSRLILESCLHKASVFCTLTYSPEFLPEDGGLVPSHLSGFIKRLREFIEPVKIRFFGVGEYGDRTFRPHYHCIIFGVDSAVVGDVKKAWPFGHVHVAPLSVELCRYCCGYVTKKMTKKTDPRLCGRHPEFVRMSRRPGIGAGAAGEVARHVNTAYGRRAYAVAGDVPQEVRFAGQKWPLGRFVRSKVRAAAGLPVGAAHQRLELKGPSVEGDAWLKAFEGLEARRKRRALSRSGSGASARFKISNRRSRL